MFYWQYSTISEVQRSLYLGRVGTRLVQADGPKICGGEREGLLKENVLVSLKKTCIVKTALHEVGKTQIIVQNPCKIC